MGFKPAGWVLVPADDVFEPVLAFGRDALTPETFKQSLLFHMVSVNTPVTRQSEYDKGRVSYLSRSDKQRNRGRNLKWSILYHTGWNAGSISKALRDAGIRHDSIEKNKLAEIVVTPILEENKWEQGELRKVNQDGVTQDALTYYDTFTKWNDRHYLVGCAALTNKALRA